MAYFVFKVFDDKSLEKLDHFDKFQEAKRFARQQREGLAEDAGFFVKIMHAANQDQAEALLKQKREPRPMGEDA